MGHERTSPTMPYQKGKVIRATTKSTTIDGRLAFDTKNDGVCESREDNGNSVLQIPNKGRDVAVVTSEWHGRVDATHVLQLLAQPSLLGLSRSTSGEGVQREHVEANGVELIQDLFQLVDGRVIKTGVGVRHPVLLVRVVDAGLPDLGGRWPFRATWEG